MHASVGFFTVPRVHPRYIACWCANVVDNGMCAVLSHLLSVTSTMFVCVVAQVVCVCVCVCVCVRVSTETLILWLVQSLSPVFGFINGW